MKEHLLQLPADGSTLPVFVTHPEQGGPFPAVILYMDFWGVREELYDLARRMATVGYYCMVPDFYYRQGTIRTAYRDANGRMISAHLLSEDQRLKALAPMHKLTDEMVMQDTAVILEFLKSGQPAREGPMGCIGFCQGGRHVVLAGAHFPGRFKAMASMHPTSLVTDSGNSPHLLMPQMRGEIYFGLAEMDRHTPPAMIQALREVLTACEVAYHIEVHSGADHGYALPDRDIHDKRAAMRDWEMIFAMFRRRIS